MRPAWRRRRPATALPGRWRPARRRSPADPAISAPAWRNTDPPAAGRAPPGPPARSARWRHPGRTRRRYGGRSSRPAGRCRARCRTRPASRPRRSRSHWPRRRCSAPPAASPCLRASAAWYTGASGAPWPPAATSAERKSYATGTPVRQASSAASPICQVRRRSRLVQDGLAVEADQVGRAPQRRHRPDVILGQPRRGALQPPVVRVPASARWSRIRRRSARSRSS